MSDQVTNSSRVLPNTCKEELKHRRLTSLQYYIYAAGTGQRLGMAVDENTQPAQAEAAQGGLAAVHCSSLVVCYSP
jgi:hypothetical protein